MKPQEPIPHNYNMRRLNLIFALSSLALLAVTGGMVLYDYVRGWKWFQIEFNRLQRERIESDLRAANDAETRRKLADLDRQMRQRQIEIARERDQFLIAQEELKKWDGRHYAADQDYRFAKANLDAQRYTAETAVVHGHSDADAQQREFKRQSKHVQELQVRLQEVSRGRDAAKRRVDHWQKRITDIEEKRKQLTASIELLNKQLQNVAANTNFFVLNAPMLDFINPTLKIDQVVLPDLFIDMNYMSVPRVDRCQTCHRAIDRSGFESKKEARRLIAELSQQLDKNLVAPSKREETEERVAQLERIESAPHEYMNPFRTHPKLDLFVGSASPHPLLEFGCTACHRGQDRATEFGRAGHTPASARMEHRWASGSFGGFLPGPHDYKQRHWGYEPNPFLETPMFPRQHYEAGCITCHSGQMAVNRGDHITKATAMVELYGCHACHKINTWRFSDLQKPGPSLEGIAEKTTPEWALRWISNPHSFRSTTRMPAFFYQRNMIGPAVPAGERAQNIRYQDAEIHSIVTYLFAKSTHRQWAGGEGGDAARGKQIVEGVGCLGCHLAQDTVTDKDGKVRPARRDDFPLERNFGFNLVGVGTKTNPAWIYNWVKNPKNYDRHAPMPSLRLTDQEAADVTAYLMTLRKPDFLQQPIRPADPRAVRELAKEYLINTLTDREADAKLSAMTMRDQMLYLGQRSIEKYGCYSCHDLKGFEGLKPIGTELTTEGSKTLHLFDFGFVHEYKHEDGKKEHIIHTVPSWVYNKVRSPRIYDDERTKPYNDKLKMPNFKLTEEEARLITSVVLGQTKERIAPEKLAARDSRMRLIEEGRKVVSQNNCRACHVVDGRGRAIGDLIADQNFLPPDLTPEGGRAQSPWLFNFLKDPTVMKIRPWMNVRMPTFHFTDEQANRLVTYFASEARAPQFATNLQTDPRPENVAVGHVVFDMLRCVQCHAVTPVNPENPPVPNTADTTSLAPNLTLSRIRLRHDWIPNWIRRPDEIIPGTRMPTNFPRDGETGGFQSPLAQAMDSPAFAQQKATLMRFFRSEEELKKTMADPVALTEYLRDYIWSIGIREMRAARPDGEQPLVTSPTAPSLPPELPGLRSTRSEPPPPVGSVARK